jgi:hypothetical protein
MATKFVGSEETYTCEGESPQPEDDDVKRGSWKLVGNPLIAPPSFAYTYCVAE